METMHQNFKPHLSKPITQGTHKDLRIIPTQILITQDGEIILISLGETKGIRDNNKLLPKRKKRPNQDIAIEKLIKETKTRFNNQKASIKNLQLQIDQLTRHIANLEKPQGNLLSNTIPKPMEHYNAITLRSRRIM